MYGHECKKKNNWNSKQKQSKFLKHNFPNTVTVAINEKRLDNTKVKISKLSYQPLTT